jgi:uncharacterized protein (DUF2384 family)
MSPTELEKRAASDAIGWAHESLDLGYQDIGRAVDADERTVRRWQGREVVPRGRHREKLEQLRELRHLLGVVFEEQANADAWLHVSVPAFRGRTPISLIRSGKLDAVIDVLATMEAGAFV